MGTNRLERRLIGGGLLVMLALVGALVWQAWEARGRAQADESRGATAVAALAPTWTASAQPQATPTTPPRPTAPATSVPTGAPATPRPASPTLAPPTAIPATRPAAAATPTEEGRYLGRDPLPPGIDLTNGPFLKELKARGAKGVTVGDGGLGDELKAAYVAALKVEEESLNSADDSRLQQHFTGEALDELLRRIDRRRKDTAKYTTTVSFEPRVMEFIPETALPGTYEVVDARTETISTVERLTDGKLGMVVKAGEPSRVCFSVTMVKDGGRWKVEFEGSRRDGPNGHKCPPYWS